MILSSEHKNNAALIAHEQCHQQQQRDYGTLRFWWRLAPEDTFKVASILHSSYGFDITLGEALQLVTPDAKDGTK